MNFLLAVLGHLRASLLSFPFPAFPARFLFFSLSPAPELPAYGQSSTKKASAEEWELTSSVHPHNLRNSNTTFSFLDRTLKQAKDDSNIAVLFSRTDYLCCLFPRRLSPCESGRRAREKGKEKGCETSGRFVFKMAECSMADDNAIFKKEHRPVRFTFWRKSGFPSSSVPGGSCFPTIERATASLQDSPSRCPCHTEKLSKKPSLLERKKLYANDVRNVFVTHWWLVVILQRQQTSRNNSVYLQLVCEI